jgi:hypothetical protein
MKIRSKVLALFAVPLCLTACGEGWEMQRTTNFFPYGNQRTAGSGVMYVRAKMMPEKAMNLAPVERPRVVEQAAPPVQEPVAPADPLFNETQKK